MIENKCNRFWFPRHEWEKWEFLGEGDLTESGKRVGTYIMQQRKCIVCGKVERKKTKYF